MDIIVDASLFHIHGLIRGPPSAIWWSKPINTFHLRRHRRMQPLGYLYNPCMNPESMPMCMFIAKDAPLGSKLPTMLQHPSLFGHLAQPAQHLSIALDEAIDGVGDPDLVAELPHQRLGLA